MNHDTQALDRALQAMPACSGLKFRNFRPGERTRNAWGDGSLETVFKGRRTEYRVRMMARLYGAALERLIAGEAAAAKGTRPLLIVADHVAAIHAEMLRKAGIAFIDSVGNVSLELPGLQLLLLGRPRPPADGSVNQGRLFHRAGMKLAFALLTDPAPADKPDLALINQPFRQIRERTGLALGSITAVMGELREGGYLIEEQGSRWLADRQRLLEKWVSAYGDRLRPRLVRGRYRSAIGRLGMEDIKLPPGIFWGGEMAAAKLTNLLRPGAACVYAATAAGEFILQHDLRPDPGGDIEILDAFWGDWPHAVRGDCVHPLLVYADLLASDIDRNLDTARRIYGQFLRQAAEAR